VDALIILAGVLLAWIIWTAIDLAAFLRRERRR